MEGFARAGAPRLHAFRAGASGRFGPRLAGRGGCVVPDRSAVRDGAADLDEEGGEARAWSDRASKVSPTTEAQRHRDSESTRLFCQVLLIGEACLFPLCLCASVVSNLAN